LGAGMSRNEKKNEHHFKELETAYNRYFYLFINGGSDPSWADGVNMNLCSNHFFYYKEQIKQFYPERKWTCLDWIYETLLPRVDYEYMARKEEIKKHAVESPRLFEEDKNLALFLEKAPFFDKKEKDYLAISCVCGYYINLLHALKTDDYVTMRRYENPENYFESFAEYAGKLKNIDLGRFA
jgi:hypothetical protein